MSGFENLRSDYSQLLHPRIDPTDKYDPTFTGITRKRRIELPKREEIVREKPPGKIINYAALAHDAQAMSQLPDCYKPEPFTSDVVNSRFGKGFMRRTGQSIGVAAQRELEAQRQAERQERVLAGKRETVMRRTLDQRDACNPITGTAPMGMPPSSSSSSTAAAGGSSLAPVRAASTNAARQRAMQQGATHLFEPADPSPTRAQESRRQRIVSEGLTTTKKDWSVRQQLGCYDGYVLPAVPGSLPAAPVPRTAPSKPSWWPEK